MPDWTLSTLLTEHEHTKNILEYLILQNILFSLGTVFFEKSQNWIDLGLSWNWFVWG